MSKFSRNGSPMAPERVSEKFKLLKYEHIIYHFEAHDLEIPLIYAKILKVWFFSDTHSGAIWEVISRKFAHKFAKSKYFSKIYNKSESPEDSL